MKPGLHTLLSRLAENSADHHTVRTTTYIIPAQPSPPHHHPPPRVQPTLPSNPAFKGRDKFTTDQLVLHRLDRSQRSILRKQVPSDPAYPDISPYAGDWEASAPPYNFWDQGASLCEPWRHRVMHPIDTETLEDVATENRMEGRVVRALEPEFTRAVDKEDFRRRMFVQFGWTEGVGPTLPPADIERKAGVSELSSLEEREALGKPAPGRITVWPTALSMFVPPRESDKVSSVSPIGTDEVVGQQHWHLAQDYQLLEEEKHDPFQDYYQDIIASPREPPPNPFEDNLYPISDCWGSSVYSGPPRTPTTGRKPSPELLMSNEAEATGPSLIVPFSWPEIPPSSSESKGPVPPLPLSQRSFLSFSKDQPVHVVGRKPLPRTETAPQWAENGRVDFDGQGWEKLEKMPTAPDVVGREGLTFQEALRESRARVVKAEREEVEKMALKKRKGVGAWLSRLRN